ncbi:LTA synthase family protein [Vibrio caribbeanicus]|nr:LTA synthase family protein [Vibrio caribbeanicus]MCY9846440.1 LTA synthase family protein [Vibrio caribbeanicus]
MFVRNTIITFSLLLAVAFLSKCIALATFEQLPVELLSKSGIEALFFGLRLDGTIAALLTAPIFLLLCITTPFRKDISILIKIWLSFAVLWIIGTTFSDAVYAKDASKHVTFELFTAGGLEKELFISTISHYFFDFCLGTLWFFACTWLIWKKLPLSAQSIPKWYTGIVFGLSWLLITVTFVRGGWSDAPQSPMRAYTIGDTDQAFIAWSAPYSITYYLTSGKKHSVEKITTEPTGEELKQWKYAKQNSIAQNLSSLKEANIVIILLESWPAIDSKSYSGGENVTPFFDSLRQKSLSAYSSYADGYRTVQGMFSTFCSYPNPIDGFIGNSQLQTSKYVCLPNILKSRGWETTFIQGSGKGLVGSFSQTLGFEHSLGKKDFPFEAVKNYWGYMDTSIYRFALNKIEEASQSTKPFLITINTGTTHDTFIPEGREYRFGKDTPDNERRSVINYADSELSEFIPKLDKKLSQLDKPTVVVVVSDHTARTSQGGFVKNAIPFLMYSSDGSLPAEIRPITSSQRDIAPTLLDWLGGYAPWFTGHSLLDPNYSGRSSFSFGSGFFWMKKDHGISINAKTGELAQCFNIGDNVVSKKTVNCDEQEWAQELYKEGSYYNNLSQYHLFNGTTTDYRSKPTSSEFQYSAQN